MVSLVSWCLKSKRSFFNDLFFFFPPRSIDYKAGFPLIDVDIVPHSSEEATRVF